ncbi:MAG: DUF1467 family protein [Geminicoccaceae bacterium]
MSWFGTAVIFLVVWWLVLFMVLPFGAAPPEEIQPGTSTGAPARPHLALKAAITTVIALLLTAAILWIMQSGLVQLRPAP